MASPPDRAAPDDDTAILLHECLTDALAVSQPERHELFLLKEALYSMANDAFLTAYLLWPVLRRGGPADDPFAAYFELWRRRSTVIFYRDGPQRLASVEHA